jgi:accessory gene regulator B
MSYLSLSRKWAAKLAEDHHLGEEKQAEMAYAIEILALTIVNAVLTLILGWALGVVWGTLACILTIAAFRHNAGGGHSESPWRCALVTMIVIPILALTAGYVSTWQYSYKDILSLVSIFFGFVFILRYAPVDNPKAPIVSPVRRKKLKTLAFIIMAFLAMIIIGLRFSSWEKAAEIRMCLVLSILWVSFNLTPLGHRLWCFIDGIELKKGRRCTE